MPETHHDDIYHHAALYDLAFSYRDYVAEVDFLLAASYGGFNLEMALNDPRAWRMILVLERQESGSSA
ncbi:MAG: hypothetical protein AB7I41_10030 [Candidatus Sericytochromatia bacterium]